MTQGDGLLRAFAKAFVDALKGGDADREPPPGPPAGQLPPGDLPVVRIAYQELYECEVPDNDPAGRYVYYWPFAAPPVAGQRVVVTSAINPDGCHAVVTGLGSVEDAKGIPLKTVVALVPDDEVEKAQREGDPNAKAWIRWIAHMQDQGRFLDGVPDMRKLRDKEDGAGASS